MQIIEKLLPNSEISNSWLTLLQNKLAESVKLFQHSKSMWWSQAEVCKTATYPWAYPYISVWHKKSAALKQPVSEQSFW